MRIKIVEGLEVEVSNPIHTVCRIISNLKQKVPDAAASKGCTDILEYNAAIDGVESLVLALVSARVEVNEPFREAVQTALDAIANNFS